MTELTQEIVRELLDYDPETGLFVWKYRSVEWFNDGGIPKDRAAKIWNSKFLGKPALIHKNNTGHLYGNIFNKKYKAHRIAWLWFHGDFPKSGIDHINQNPSDNRIINLREADQFENMKNMKMSKRNTSGHTGISFHLKTKKWRCYIRVKERIKHLGLFSSLEKAVEVRKKAEKYYGYHENHGNDRK